MASVRTARVRLPATGRFASVSSAGSGPASAKVPSRLIGSGSGAYDRAVTLFILLLILVALVTLLYMRGLLNLRNILSVYRRIRLALLLAVVAILIIGLLRILGIGTGD